MAAPSLIENTLQVWQPYYEEPLSSTDGEEILSNWSAYIGLLSEWAAQYKQAS